VSEAACETRPIDNTPTQKQYRLLTSANRHGKPTPELLAGGGFDSQPIYQEVALTPAAPRRTKIKV
jgi:hypothetical protein